MQFYFLFPIRDFQCKFEIEMDKRQLYFATGFREEALSFTINMISM